DFQNTNAVVAYSSIGRSAIIANRLGVQSGFVGPEIQVATGLATWDPEISIAADPWNDSFVVAYDPGPGVQVAEVRASNAVVRQHIGPDFTRSSPWVSIAADGDYLLTYTRKSSSGRGDIIRRSGPLS